MNCSHADCILEKANPDWMLRVFIVVPSESDPKACSIYRFGPGIGLIVIEAGASLHAILEEVDNDLKNDTAS